MCIEKEDIIVRFDKWVEGLPPEHRSEAYRFAQSFVGLGSRYGALVGVSAGIAAASMSGKAPSKNKGDKQEECLTYLHKKQKENEV